ncbi:DivIVA domain-containing protein [Rothia sp. CCM 9418]|uniref:DivIVA domain-containing protein n=1 Tax=Rothia sp. CCM 9418 TaxID=3402661 RepID=UPI003ADF94BD
MALTPEAVINKRFQATKFKEGYNPEEVDDFLDEIVVELRRLNSENATLKRNLEEAESRLSQAQEQLEQAEAQGSSVVASTVEEQTVPVAAAAAVAEPQAATSTDPEATDAAEAATGGLGMGTNSAAGLLAMAQKVHDDYIFQGETERERLISEAREESARLLTSAQEERSKVLGDLEQNKVNLEATVEKLRGFEKKYREGMRKYIEEQLQDLESAPSVESKLDSTATPTGSSFMR